MYEDQIAKGIQLLNEKGPKGWLEKIHIDRLDMSNPFLCVLGQLSGSYWDGLDALGLRIFFEGGSRVTNWGLTEPHVIGYGFLLSVYDASHFYYRTLTVEWKAALNGLSS